MANGDSTLYPGPPDVKSVLVGVIKKDGMLGVVLVATLWFIYTSYKNQREDNLKMMPVIEKNTETIGRNTAVQERAINTLDRTNAALDRLDRRLDRRPQ